MAIKYIKSIRISSENVNHYNQAVVENEDAIFLVSKLFGVNADYNVGTLNGLDCVNYV